MMSSATYGERKGTMKFSEIQSWGFVDPGTRVQDADGNRYVVMKQNDAGFLELKNISGGESDAFEALDTIDHERFRESD